MKLPFMIRAFVVALACVCLQTQAANVPEVLSKLPPPGVQSLVEQVRAAAPNQELLQKYKQIYATEIPANASLSKRAEMLKERAVVAFATHGLLPGEFPGVDQPSLAMANPGQGQHGLLTLDEILGLKLDADWVVLSACNTAAGDGNGAEAVSGLGRGFFYAGTRALLATHWPVESTSARLLVTATFEQQAQHPGMSRAQALRASMLQLMNQQAPEGFSYAHPLFWAPYALFGDGGP